MDSASQKWLVGCGTGCAALVIVMVFLVGGAVVFIRDKIRPLQEASDSHKEVVTAFGAAESFVPPADGAIGRERIEVFLGIRDALKDAQDRLDSALGGVDFQRMTQRKQSFSEALRTLNDLSNLIGPAGDYVGRRNRALLDRHMGLGEYAYIYTMAYHSWLGHLPEEGPPILAKLDRWNDASHSSSDGGFSPEAIRWQYRRFIRRILQNQLSGIKDAEHQSLRVMINQEIERIDKSMDRVAWQDNMPQPIEECFKPYRGRLEATYRASTNCFELFTFDESRQIEWHGPGTSVEIKSEPGSKSGPAEAPPNYSAGAFSVKGMPGSSVSYVVGDGVTAPVLITRRMPLYTDQARKAHAEGVVTIQAIVRKNGSLGSAKVTHKLGYGLDEAVLNTVMNKWKFRPGKMNGQPIDVQADIKIVFRLP